MSDRQIIVSDEVFALCPEFKRGIVVVSELRNDESVPQLERMMREAVELRRDQQNLAHPKLLDWEEIHRGFGSNPNKFPPSIKSLVKRVASGAELPFINAVVAIFNTVSLNHLIPCGGDDLDTIAGNLRLDRSRGDEGFTPLGSEQPEAPKPGEVIYYDEGTKRIMCRRWNWRNGDFSKITPATKRMVINLDGGPSTPASEIERATAELADLLKRFCFAVSETALLDRKNPRYAIES